MGAGGAIVSPVLPYTSVVGVPARIVGVKHGVLPCVTMDQALIEPDYTI